MKRKAKEPVSGMLAGVEFEVIAHEEEMQVRGNALASGDDAVDKRCEDRILARLESGDIWAWCTVEVKATWQGIEASDYLGGCSYDDETDFCHPKGYYPQMMQSALEELEAKVSALLESAKSLA